MHKQVSAVLTAVASYILLSPIGMACVQPQTAYGTITGLAATPGQKAALVRIQNQFRRLKAGQTKLRSNDASQPPSVVGMWMTTFTSGGEVVDAGFDVWHSDGTQILNDTPPPAAGAVCLGIWIQTDVYSYQLKHPSWVYDETNTNLVGTVYILEQVTLDPGGDSFSGTFSYEGYDLDGNHVFHEDGEISGDRITTDPPADAGPLNRSTNGRR